ncbi:MAG TPA: hypothetical protein VHR84_18225 [Terriglobales bacterium]|jgi:hypothetical protein|nr:hypothetical protein [Terriglobales bacterium]
MFPLITQILAAFAAIYVWWLVVALVVRQLGIPFHSSPPFVELKQEPNLPNYRQYVAINGIAYFGCGMFIATTLAEFVSWKYWGDQSRSISTGRVLSGAIIWLVAGFVFGLVTWKPGKQPVSSRFTLLRF